MEEPDKSNIAALAMAIVAGLCFGYWMKNAGAGILAAMLWLKFAH